jgi:arginine/lysine/ornithine decarboxylase
LTSPTYEGIGSDILAIAALCREQNVLLVVDEAHGSLWPLSEHLPPSACQSGADIVIHSLHKSGGSLTQSALAHLPVGSRVDAAVFQQALNTLQTTSPSYLLMASLDAACGFLASEAGAERVASLLQQVHSLRAVLKRELRHLRLYEANHPWWDPCKFYVKHPIESGEDWGARLEEDSQIAYESASLDGVLYLANLGLETADFEAFLEILLAEDAALNGKALNGEMPQSELTPELLVPVMRLLPRGAFFQPGETASGAALVGRIAKETVVHCPPGIPVLVPGEEIRPVHLPFLPEIGVLVVR